MRFHCLSSLYVNLENGFHENKHQKCFAMFWVKNSPNKHVLKKTFFGLEG